MRRTFHHAVACSTALALPDVTSPTRAGRLDPLRLLCISGPDGQAFLQAQLTQDLRLLTDGNCLRYAWTSAQGRVLANGSLSRWQDRYLLGVAADLVSSIAQRLQKFVLRSRVSIEESAPDLLERLLAGNELPAGPDWEGADIAGGVPMVSAATSDKYVPQMLNLDLIGAVSFTKGCYPGQEVIARTRHLGRVKRRLYRLRTPASMAVNSPVFGTDGEIGRVVNTARSASGGEALAVIQATAAALPMFADEQLAIGLERLALPYTMP
ncbi:MAG: folate-binding protein YgfZ [Gammaproteobacteria bacterium]|nr:folate-binding protein YgfZ [Gammaproteobacteria bacterium]